MTRWRRVIIITSDNLSQLSSFDSQSSPITMLNYTYVYVLICISSYIIKKGILIWGRRTSHGACVLQDPSLLEVRYLIKTNVDNNYNI